MELYTLMGHCDNPNCTNETLEVWQTHEVVLTVNHQSVRVQRYCSDCMNSIMQDIHTALLRPEPVVEQLPNGERVIISPGVLAARKAQEAAQSGTSESQ